MCQKRTDSQKPLSGACAKVQGQATAQLQLSNQSPVMCQLGISVMRISKPKRPIALKKYPSHSITSSASANKFGGTVRPSVFTVLILITSSNLVGCTTGRSDGFSPLRML